ncbi:tetratricopeptide repeat protein [Myxococcus sp. CA051A]|uniref:tetratricopeptide repeat protein n=2 Tax=unclassified Myxococcus TaxID=2648731 RepID=UPI00157AA3A5|nr:tetratricopeptide repeat protein [Myxococcus sp. CA051A]NTX62999.1 tetratricopeptide repeat protein [Myxococcus sp. CA051A]
MTTRVKGRAETSPADDEFLQQLQRGGELLAANKVIEAKEFLERAHQLQPRNEKAQNLLGLCYFKLGLFDRAAELYEMLVRDNPVDPTLRVNLGLVYLKTNALQRAVREFETATDLSPEHQKAQNYLGLALAQMGEYGRAREHFLLAGSDQMADKMSRAIAGENYSRPTPAPVSPPARPELPPPVPVPPPAREVAPPPPAVDAAPRDEEIRFAEDEGPSALSDSDGEGGPVLTAAPEETVDLEEETPAATAPTPNGDEAPRDVATVPTPVPLTKLQLTKVAARGADAALTEKAAAAPRRGVSGASAPGATGTLVSTAPLLSELAPSLSLDDERGGRPFVLGEGRFSVAVDGELLTRLDGVVALRGQLAFQPEMKRFRGRATDKPFGEGPSRMVRAKGHGVLHLEPAERRTFLVVDLGEDSAYFRDENVFAFEEPVMFENGRVPSDIAPDLDLVHLRGQGQVLLSLPGPLRSVQVRPDAPVTVPLTHLVGWQGNLTPRVVPLLKSPAGESLRTAVELGGEGFALIALGVR